MKLKDCLLEYSPDEKPEFDDEKPVGHYDAPDRDEDSEDEEEKNESLELKDMRIVEGVNPSDLASLDEGGEILGTELNLRDASTLRFDKHVKAIAIADEASKNRRKALETLDEAYERKQEFDRRYKEMPRDTIRYK